MMALAGTTGLWWAMVGTRTWTPHKWEQLTPPHGHYGQCWTLLFPGLEDINPVSPASEFHPTAARIKTTQQLTIFLDSQTDSHSVQCLF